MARHESNWFWTKEAISMVNGEMEGSNGKLYFP